jgi:hypothetical protein
LYLGGDVEDGLMARIQIGINATADHTDDEYYAVAADDQAGGGVADGNAMGVGGDVGGAGGNETLPSGGMPCGTVLSGSAPMGV